MTQISNDQLKNLATHAATAYVRDGIPLDDTIVKEAQELELNPDQIKRTVETTNQVTYLTLLKDAEDRTLEFPVASADSVLKQVAGIDSDGGQEKTASAQVTDPLSVFVQDQEITKQASKEDYKFQPQEKDAISLLWKEAKRLEGDLTKAAEESEQIMVELSNQGEKIKKDPHLMSKLAEVTETEDDFNGFCRLLDVTPDFEKLASDYSVFRDKDFDEVRRFTDLYKQAKDLRDYIKKGDERLEKASSILGKHSDKLKSLGRKAMGAPVHGIGGAIGHATGALAGGIPAAGYKATKKGMGAILSGGKKDKSALSKAISPELGDLLGPIGLQTHDGVWDSLHGS